LVLSSLDPAEIEVSLWSRECMGRDRIATLCELKHRTHLWKKAAACARRKINGDSPLPPPAASSDTGRALHLRQSTRSTTANLIVTLRSKD
jgi:hypothetical protein